MFDKVTAKLCQALNDMTDLTPVEIKINIKDLQTREEYVKKNRKAEKGEKKKDKD